MKQKILILGLGGLSIALAIALYTNTTKKDTAVIETEKNISVCSDTSKQENSIAGLNLNIEQFALEFEKSKINSNRGVILHDIKLAFQKQLENGWTGFIFDLDITAQNQRFITKDILFTNGVYATSSLTSKDGVDLKRLMHPTLDARFTDDKYRIAGEKDAKNTLVIFSEPLCPACVNVLPAYINEVNNSADLALYYIPMPLDMHPTARILVQAAKKAKLDGIKDVDMKLYNATSNIYKTNPRTPFDPYQETSNEKALNFFNQIMGTNYTLEEVNTKELLQYVEDSLSLANDSMANGTPTIFFNNEIDPMRNGHKHLINR